ncbi:DUF4974 domain-containing protein [Bacteroidales bacterium OttesenSCG-928-A17]|nr:DUF4974 domain-containing protein [Bacteroidales bacterium OttesenSCG-928-A17]
MEKNIPWDLLISHLKQETDPNKERELSEWRSLDDNDSLYNEIYSLWNNIKKESSAYNPDTSYYWEEMKTRMDTMGKKRKTLSIPLQKLRISIVAASILLFISVSSSHFFTKTYFQPKISTQTHKALNGKSQLVLPDGTEVWLNVGSTLSYKTTFLKDRQVTLDGEALFNVYNDTRHPFVVSAEDVQIKVLGTRFNVEAYPANDIIRVALSSGKVNISACEQSLLMNPGDVVTFDKNTFLLSKIKGDVVFESFWAAHSYAFEAKPLRHICKYLERWYNITIELDPIIADSQIYTFTVNDEPLETILQIMSRINPIQYSFEEDKRVIINEKCHHKKGKPMK